MPYPTAVLADRLVAGQQVNLAVAFYSVGQVLPALAMCVLFQYCRSVGLLAPAVREDLLRRLTWLTWGSVIAYFVSIGLALVAPALSLVYYALAPVYWAIDGARARHELPKGSADAPAYRISAGADSAGRQRLNILVPGHGQSREPHHTPGGGLGR